MDLPPHRGTPAIPEEIRAFEVDRFTLDDLLAVTFLGVTVPPEAAWQLLCGKPTYFSELLPERAGSSPSPGCPHDYGDQWMIRRPDGKLGQFGRQTRRGPQSGQ